MAEKFHGLRVPEGPDMRELYNSQYRVIYAFKMSFKELTDLVNDICVADGWVVSSDERVDGAGTFAVSKDDVEVQVCLEDYPEPQIVALKYFLSTRASRKLPKPPPPAA
eukprot:CAMPEP_0118937116 /NCGR_PEP_ID=MMETSP1169-20130426/21673_1 /TAXON_ID=36882 /ORGANISM="Pyramimonas obovata, Strain CCMP722" /LENGTH=108 /DNA_ID=CAMNT_0006880653 /DNA_START=74 /DNA_END=400 /DNA_ORIENTATION=+